MGLCAEHVWGPLTNAPQRFFALTTMSCPWAMVVSLVTSRRRQIMGVMSRSDTLSWYTLMGVGVVVALMRRCSPEDDRTGGSVQT